jgi:succinylglutamate desuccinylase
MEDDNKPSSSAPLNVVVIGGTHGNEYTGVWCVRALTNNEKRCTTLLGNPAAVAANQRFIDDDLNRQFKASDLQNNLATDTVERKRAKELNELLGPKEAPKTDVIIDMHTTTCNMGLSLIIAEGDTLMAKVAAYIVKHVPHDNQGRKTRIILHAGLDRLERPLLDSLAKHGMTIEVGPVPQGVLRHDAANVTMRAVLAALDVLEQHPSSNDNDDYGLPEYVECFYGIPAVRPGDVDGKIPWPAPPSGAAAVTCGLATPNIPSYMIHQDRQDRDFEPIRTGDPLFVYHDGTVLPYSGSHGDEVYLYFINGAGYYNAKSGSGISVGAKTWYEVATATRVGTSEVGK